MTPWTLNYVTHGQPVAWVGTRHAFQRLVAPSRHRRLGLVRTTQRRSSNADTHGQTISSPACLLALAACMTTPLDGLVSFQLLARCTPSLHRLNLHRRLLGQMFAHTTSAPCWTICIHKGGRYIAALAALDPRSCGQVHTLQ